MVAARKEPSFEASTEKLTRIVEELEQGDLPLERSLSLFEDGMKLLRDAQGKLERAEKKVEELLGFDETGKPQVQPLTPRGAVQDEDEQDEDEDQHDEDDEDEE